jgi:hypothetical protein
MGGALVVLFLGAIGVLIYYLTRPNKGKTTTTGTPGGTTAVATTTTSGALDTTVAATTTSGAVDTTTTSGGVTTNNGGGGGNTFWDFITNPGFGVFGALLVGVIALVVALFVLLFSGGFGREFGRGLYRGTKGFVLETGKGAVTGVYTGLETAKGAYRRARGKRGQDSAQVGNRRNSGSSLDSDATSGEV